jgi:prolyl-tRNA synthetase
MKSLCFHLARVLRNSSSDTFFPVFAASFDTALLFDIGSLQYFEWERKGVPLRIEIGPRDVKKNQCVLKWRINFNSSSSEEGEEKKNKKEIKTSVDLDDIGEVVERGMKEMQSILLSRARARLAKGVAYCDSYETMKSALARNEGATFPGQGLFLAPWYKSDINEEKIKEESKATIRCYPNHENEMKMADGKKCFYSGNEANVMAIFGRNF